MNPWSALLNGGMLAQGRSGGNEEGFPVVGQFPITRLTRTCRAVKSLDVAIAALFEPFQVEPWLIHVNKSLHNLVHARMVEMTQPVQGR